MLDIKGKWALVTGSARGIGRLAAIELAKNGCNLILHSRELSHTSELESMLKSEYGIECYSVATELAKPQLVADMLDFIDKKGTAVDILLNNAAMQIAYRSDFLTTPVSDYEQSFYINTIAPMMMVYHFLPQMIKRGFGRIVNTTSGITLEPEQAGYSASKAALDKVTIDIGSKLEGSNVMINLTDPGWCRTDLGGPHAPNAPESAIPGVVVGAFVDDKKSGRLFAASHFAGLSLEQAVKKAESEFDSPYRK